VTSRHTKHLRRALALYTPRSKNGAVGRCYAEDTELRGRRYTGPPVAHPKVVSERLGHATISITLDTYSHAIPAMQEEAAALIAGLVFAGEQARSVS